MYQSNDMLFVFYLSDRWSWTLSKSLPDAHIVWHLCVTQIGRAPPPSRGRAGLSPYNFVPAPWAITSEQCPAPGIILSPPPGARPPAPGASLDFWPRPQIKAILLWSSGITSARCWAYLSFKLIFDRPLSQDKVGHWVSPKMLSPPWDLSLKLFYSTSGVHFCSQGWRMYHVWVESIAA